MMVLYINKKPTNLESVIGSGRNGHKKYQQNIGLKRNGWNRSWISNSISSRNSYGIHERMTAYLLHNGSAS